MAWTDPATLAVAEWVNEAWLDTNVKANQDFYSTHTHSGVPGDGSADITPDTITFTDQVSDPAAPGQGLTVIYSKSGTLWQRAGLSGTAEEISVVGHTHP